MDIVSLKPLPLSLERPNSVLIGPEDGQADPYDDLPAGERRQRAITHMRECVDEEGRALMRELMRRFGGTLYTPDGGRLDHPSSRKPASTNPPTAS